MFGDQTNVLMFLIKGILTNASVTGKFFNLPGGVNDCLQFQFFKMFSH